MLLSACSETKKPPGRSGKFPYSVPRTRDCSRGGATVGRSRQADGEDRDLPPLARAGVRTAPETGSAEVYSASSSEAPPVRADRPRARDTAPIPETMTYTPSEFSRIGVFHNVFYGQSAAGRFEATCYQKQSLRSDRPRDLVRRPKHQDNDRRLGKQTRKQNVVVVSPLLHPKSGRFRPATHGPAVSGCRAGRAPGPARPQGRPAGRGAARRRRRAGRAPAGASAPVTGRGAGPCASAGASALVLVAAQLPRATDWGMLGFGAGHGAAAGDDNMAQ